MTKFLARILEKPSKITAEQFLAVSMSFFLAMFFFIPSDSIHRNFYYILVLLPYLFVFFDNKPVELLKTRTIKILYLFLLYFLVSLLWSQGPDIDAVYNIVRKELLVLFFIISLAWLWNQGYQEYLLRGLLLGAFIGVLLSIYYYYIHLGNDWQSRLEGFDRGGHAIKSPVMYGAVLVTLFCCLDKIKRYRWLAYIAMMLFLVFVLLSQTRGILIATLASISACLLLKGKIRTILAMLVAAIIGLAYAYYADIFSRMLTLQDVRYEIWQQALRDWSLHPIFGFGIYPEREVILPSGVSYVHPHNIFISHLLYGGIVGLTLLILVWLSICFSAFRCWLNQRDLLPLGLFFYSTWVGLFDFSTLIKSADVEWIFFWFMVALIIAYEARCKKAL